MKGKHVNAIKYATALLIAFLLMAGGIAGIYKVYAMSATVQMSPSKTSVRPGETVTVAFTITPTAPSLFTATVSVSSGLRLDGIVCHQTGSEINGSTIIRTSNSPIYTGTIQVTAISAGDQRVGFSTIDLADETNPTDKIRITNQFVTFHVKTAGEIAAEESIAASIAASEQASREQASREAASRQAELASRAAEEASRRASEEASRNAAASESASIEESILESEFESRSIEESIEESISVSESLEERTRPTEDGDFTFILLEWHSEGKTKEDPNRSFYFASEDTAVPFPEGYVRTILRIGEYKMPVLALKADGMDKDTYLVYGMQKRREEPLWYYFHASTNEFFNFDYLNSGAAFEETTEEETTEEETSGTENAVTKDADPLFGLNEIEKALLVVLFSAMIGAALTLFIVLLCSLGKKKKAAVREKMPENAPEVNAGSGSLRRKAPIIEEPGSLQKKAPVKPEEKTGTQKKQPARFFEESIPGDFTGDGEDALNLASFKKPDSPLVIREISDPEEENREPVKFTLPNDTEGEKQ